MRTVGWMLVAAGCLSAFIALGSRRPVPPTDARAAAASMPHGPGELDAWIAAREAASGDVIEGVEERIRWAGEPGDVAPVAIVYLHGFSATRKELHPTLDLVRDDLAANIVFVRLRGHGLEGGDLSQASASAWLADGERAYQLASRVGDRVVVVGNSTGAPIALDLLVRHAAEDQLAGGVLLSPNFAVQNALAELLVMPWGAPIITTFMPSRCGPQETEAQRRYWTRCYTSWAVVAMQDLLTSARRLSPEAVRDPVRVFYNPDDHVLDTGYARSFLGRIPDVDFVEVEAAPDEDGHVLAGDFKAPSGTQPLRRQLVRWIGEMVEAR